MIFRERNYLIVKLFSDSPEQVYFSNLKHELIHTYIYIKCKFLYKYYIFILSFIYIAFFIKEVESSGLYRELKITMFVWKGNGVFSVIH